MKLVRTLLLLLILGAAAYSGWSVYGIVFELLDFQIGVYKVMLQAGEQVGAARDAVGGVVEQALGLFDDLSSPHPSPNRSAIATLGEGGRMGLEERLGFFERKLKFVSGIIGTIAGLLVWKILSDVVFGLKNTIDKVTNFVK